jgi:choline-sulfatase
MARRAKAQVKAAVAPTPPEKPEIPVDPAEPPPPEKEAPAEPRPEQPEPSPPAPAPEIDAPPPEKTAGVGASLRRGLLAAAAGSIALGGFEYVASLVASHGSVSVLRHGSFLGVCVALVALSFLVTGPLTAALFAVARRARVPARPVAPLLWGGAVTLAAHAAGSTAIARLLAERSERPFVDTPRALAELALVVPAALAGVLAAVVARRFARHPLPALAALAAAGLAGPPPSRVLLSALAFAAGAWWGLPRLARAPRLARLLAAVGLLALIPPALLYWSGHPEVKHLTGRASPTLSLLVAGVRAAHDVDGDGYGTLFAERDCAPFDARIHPAAAEVPDNGVDENCAGGDLETAKRPAYAAAAPLAPPPTLRPDLNLLLVTVKGLQAGTPALDALAARAVGFEEARAAAPDTFGALAAVLAARSAHGGLALGPGGELLPDNLTLAELLVEKAGFATAAVVADERLAGRGLEQGFADFSVAPGEIGARAAAWIAGRRAGRWFLWAHYADAATAERELGPLLAGLPSTPAAARTAIVVAGAHGETHAGHVGPLHDARLRVPLFVHVPGVAPRSVPGPVSLADLAPTLADLGGVDARRLRPDGESLVPQIFYGRDALDRVVFAEAAGARAAITARHKLVLDLQTYARSLHDLKLDPREGKNVWAKDPASYRMRVILEERMDRAIDARPRPKRRPAPTYIVSPPIVPANVSRAVVGGALQIAGWEAGPASAGGALEVSVYLSASAKVNADYQLELALSGGGLDVKQAKVPADEGTFPTSRWPVGQMIRETFRLELPTSAPASATLSLRVLDALGKPAPLPGGAGALALGTIEIAR